MELVYQTADMARADRIMAVLQDAGIEASLQGVESLSLDLSVWVINDGDLPRANQVLEAFFASEAPKPIPKALHPSGGPSVGFWLLIGALAVGIALGFAIYGT